MRKVLVAGVGMVKFTRPSEGVSYRTMGVNAVKDALEDAKLDFRDIQQAYAGYMYGDTCCGQRVLYDVGMSGIPVFNLNNACATGSSALFLARQAVQSGAVDCALAVGFEQMQAGALKMHWDDREMPHQKWIDCYSEWETEDAPLALRMFGAAGAAYLEKYDASPELFAQVAVKSRNHAAQNPHAVFTAPLTVDEVMQEQVIFGDYMTRLMACPPTSGAAAAIICSESFYKRKGGIQAVEIVAQAMATDTSDTWSDPICLIGQKMTRRAAEQAYNQAAIGPEEIDVIELHDCFTPNEVVTYEGLGLCEEGGATRFVADGDNTYGGRYVVNPSGGLMSKGHPIGATGLAQCAELVWQLRGMAGKRQLPSARIALQHNLGLGGASVVTLYRNS